MIETFILISEGFEHTGHGLQACFDPEKVKVMRLGSPTGHRPKHVVIVTPSREMTAVAAREFDHYCEAWKAKLPLGGSLVYL